MWEWKMRQQIALVENAGVDKVWKALKIKYSTIFSVVVLFYH